MLLNVAHPLQMRNIEPTSLIDSCKSSTFAKTIFAGMHPEPQPLRWGTAGQDFPDDQE